MAWHHTPAARDLIARIIANPTLEAVTAVAPLCSDAYRRGNWLVVSYIANSRSNPVNYRKADQLRHDLNELHTLRERHTDAVMGCRFDDCASDKARGGLWLDTFSASLSPDEAVTLALEEQMMPARKVA